MLLCQVTLHLLLYLFAPMASELDVATSIGVEVLIRGTAQLPCDLRGGEVSLVIWYRGNADTPSYTLDARSHPVPQAVHWADDRVFGGRAFLRVSDGAAHLILEGVQEDDSGYYRCRVDFRKSPTRNALVNLTVVVPPRKIRIIEENGATVTRPAVGPYGEGVEIRLRCECEGGSPPPLVAWWLGFERLTQPNYAGCELLLGPLRRQHAGRVYSCRATNTLLLDPLEADVQIDMHLAVLDVRLLGENLPLSAGSEYEVTCEAVGSRPAAVITWWKAGMQLEDAVVKVSPDGNATVSTLSLRPVASDLGKSLTCRATNPHILSEAREDTWSLLVHYTPIASVHYGPNINGSSITEGSDAYMECSVVANPPPHRLTWTLNNRHLSSNSIAGVVLSNQTLVLQSISRNHSGTYTCIATNSEGSMESNGLTLSVKYIPQCKTGQQVVFGASRAESVTVTCEVDANPPATLFRWAFNNSAVRDGQVDFQTDGPGRSVATHAASSGYGTLLCWARNELGAQHIPCAFHVVPAARPDPPRNCSLLHTTHTSLTLGCARGFDGGLPQVFFLEVRSASGRLLENLTNYQVPEFTYKGLNPGETYILQTYSANAKGRSNAVVTIEATTRKVAQQQHRRNPPAPAAAILSPSSPIIWVIAGAVAGVAIVVLILAVWRLRRGREDESRNSESDKTPPPRESDAEDTNPDVVPLRSGVLHGSVSEESHWRNGSDLYLHQRSQLSIAHEVNLLVNGQNVVVMDPQTPLLLTAVPIPQSTHPDVPLNPCILLKQPPDETALNACLLLKQPSDESMLNACILLKQASEDFPLKQSVPEETHNRLLKQSSELSNLELARRMHHVETQTPVPVRHKESAV